MRLVPNIDNESLRRVIQNKENPNGIGPIAHLKSKIALHRVSRPNTVLLKTEHRELHCIRTLITRNQNVFALNTISHD